ncbi:hypothetical protein SETIT_1G198100v2 [Setaria italica]|uniref:Uncharacterized protein n=1 Tax=Setaria italica TaxID=4555 RepID=A0A368PN11_SETIT|nr:hypothetical protein SETIT_1G198100v2 [Setaria italica]
MPPRSRRRRTGTATRPPEAAALLSCFLGSSLTPPRTAPLHPAPSAPRPRAPLLTARGSAAAVPAGTEVTVFQHPSPASCSWRSYWRRCCAPVQVPMQHSVLVTTPAAAAAVGMGDAQ